MELVLIRHGEQRTDQQGFDPELSERGEAQARALARYLATESLDAIWASPLRRAQHTAQFIATARDVTIDVGADLEELGLRDLRQGSRPIDKIVMDRVWRDLRRGNADATEFDIDGFRTRVVNAIESVIARYPSRRVAVVCHGGVINVYLASLLGIARPVWFMPMHCSIHRVRASNNGTRSVETLNEGHAYRAASPLDL